MEFIFKTLVINKIKSKATNETSPGNRKARKYNFYNFRQKFIFMTEHTNKNVPYKCTTHEHCDYIHIKGKGKAIPVNRLWRTKRL
jgi:hypothetical protein